MQLHDLSMQQKINYVQDTLYVMSGKWKLPILMAMYEGATRFRELQRAIPAITTRVLSKELKDLATNHLLVRTVYDTYPVTIEYKLTPYSYTLTPVVDALILWGHQHHQQIRQVPTAPV